MKIRRLFQIESLVLQKLVSDLIMLHYIYNPPSFHHGIPGGIHRIPLRSLSLMETMTQTCLLSTWFRRHSLAFQSLLPVSGGCVMCWLSFYIPPSFRRATSTSSQSLDCCFVQMSDPWIVRR